MAQKIKVEHNGELHDIELDDKGFLWWVRGNLKIGGDQPHPIVDTSTENLILEAKRLLDGQGMGED